MKARIVDGTRYRSRSAYAKELLLNSDMKDSDIAKTAKITPQTVHRIKVTMAGLYTR